MNILNNSIEKCKLTQIESWMKHSYKFNYSTKSTLLNDLNDAAVWILNATV